MPSQPLRRSKRIAAREAAARQAKATVDKESERVVLSEHDVAKTTKRAKSRKKRCSLQSLELPCQSPPGTPTAPKSRKKKTSSSTRRTTPTARRVTLTPRSKRSSAFLPGTTDAKAKRVSFDSGRNSFAEYSKGDPPNIVKRLSHSLSEVHRINDSATEDDETTRKNVGILAEWDGIFEYLVEGDY